MNTGCAVVAKPVSSSLPVCMVGEACMDYGIYYDDWSLLEAWVTDDWDYLCESLADDYDAYLDRLNREEESSNIPTHIARRMIRRNSARNAMRRLHPDENNPLITGDAGIGNSNLPSINDSPTVPDISQRNLIPNGRQRVNTVRPEGYGQNRPYKQGSAPGVDTTRPEGYGQNRPYKQGRVLPGPRVDTTRPEDYGQHRGYKYRSGQTVDTRYSKEHQEYKRKQREAKAGKADNNVEDIKEKVEKAEKYGDINFIRKFLAEKIAWAHGKLKEFNDKVRTAGDKAPWYKKMISYLTRALEWMTRKMHNLVSGKYQIADPDDNAKNETDAKKS